MKGPPQATLVRRAKSYSNFYDAAIGYLGKQPKPEKIVDQFEVVGEEVEDDAYETRCEQFEDNLLDGSHAEYQYSLPSFPCQSEADSN